MPHLFTSNPELGMDFRRQRIFDSRCDQGGRQIETQTRSDDGDHHHRRYVPDGTQQRCGFRDLEAARDHGNRRTYGRDYRHAASHSGDLRDNAHERDDKRGEGCKSG